MGWLPKSRRTKNAEERSHTPAMTDEEIERRLADIQRAVGGRSATWRDRSADPPAQETDWNKRAS